MTVDAAPVIVVRVVSVVVIDIEQTIVRITVEVTAGIQTRVRPVEVPVKNENPRGNAQKVPIDYLICEGECVPLAHPLRGVFGGGTRDGRSRCQRRSN